MRATAADDRNAAARICSLWTSAERLPAAPSETLIACGCVSATLNVSAVWQAPVAVREMQIPSGASQRGKGTQMWCPLGWLKNACPASTSVASLCRAAASPWMASIIASALPSVSHRATSATIRKADICTSRVTRPQSIQQTPGRVPGERKRVGRAPCTWKGSPRSVCAFWNERSEQYGLRLEQAVIFLSPTNVPCPACFGETGSSSFGIGTRHRCKIDARHPREGAMGRQLLSPTEASTCNVFAQRLDDAPVNRTLPIGERRGLIHTLSLFCVGHIVGDKKAYRMHIF